MPVSAKNRVSVLVVVKALDFKVLVLGNDVGERVGVAVE